MTRYADMLKRLLPQGGCKVRIIRPEPFFGRLKLSGEGIGKWLGYIDKFILFPLVLRRHVRRLKKESKAYDHGLKKGSFLVHICDHSNAMYIRWLWDVPHLVTCHDMLAIQSASGLISGRKTGWTGRMLQNWILSGLRRAKYLVCVSEETRKDLLSLAPELVNRSTTVENALPYPFSPMSPDDAVRSLAGLGLDAALPPEGRFLFHVGGNQWYKNREGAIRMFGCVRASFPELTRKYSLKMVMAGKPPSEAMLRLVNEMKLAHEVIFVTAVSDKQLQALYSLAEALVFPSLQEGFGWPIIEAQACGCPVVTSNRAPMNRLAGPAALLANPEDATDFAAQLGVLLFEAPEVRQRRKTEALHYSGKYDSQVFLKEVLTAYEVALKT